MIQDLIALLGVKLGPAIKLMDAIMIVKGKQPTQASVS
jgi:hypothetical protein